MKRGTKLWVKGWDGTACGPFRWTAVREWVAIGYFAPNDEVRLVDETAWCPVLELPELLVVPPGYETNEGLKQIQSLAREKKAVGPRAAAYLDQLGCPVPRQRLNPFTANQWVHIMEELRPDRASAVERWAAEEEAHGRVPSASPEDATAEQIERLRAGGHAVTGALTRQQAQRLLSGAPTEGQLRRLRFYGLPLPEGACKDEAAVLIDQYMREHWESEEAYQAYRKGTRDEAERTEVERVDGEQAKAGREEVGRDEGTTAATRIANPPPPTRVAGGGRPPGVVAAAVPTLAAKRAAEDRTSPPQRRRPLVVIGVFCIWFVGLGLAVYGWNVFRKRSEAGLDRATPAASGIRGAKSPSSDQSAERGTGAGPELAQQVQNTALSRYAMALPLTGVFGGAEPRAMIDGRMYRVGDVVDRLRGIFLVAVNPNKPSIVVGDAKGDIFERVLR